jgi:hypothetical protein
MTYDPELPGCFRDLVFAAGGPERDRAVMWLAKLRQRRVQWSDVQAQVEDYLIENGSGIFNAADQVATAKRLFQAWLSEPGWNIRSALIPAG